MIGIIPTSTYQAVFSLGVLEKTTLPYELTALWQPKCPSKSHCTVWLIDYHTHTHTINISIFSKTAQRTWFRLHMRMSMYLVCLGTNQVTWGKNSLIPILWKRAGPRSPREPTYYSCIVATLFQYQRLPDKNQSKHSKDQIQLLHPCHP